MADQFFHYFVLSYVCAFLTINGNPFLYLREFSLLKQRARYCAAYLKAAQFSGDFRCCSFHLQ